MKTLLGTAAIIGQVAIIGLVVVHSDKWPGAAEASQPHAEQMAQPQPRPYEPEQLYCLAQNVYFEARDQSVVGQQAVALSTLNRVDSSGFPDSVCDVVQQGPMDGSPITIGRCQYSWYCDGRSDVPAADDNVIEVEAWHQAQQIAREAMLGLVDDFTEGSTHFHAITVSPFWSEVYTRVGTFGEHHFYNPSL